MKRNTEDKIRINKTVFIVKRSFSGEASLENIMTEWAVRKTLEAAENELVSTKSEQLGKQLQTAV